jgi:MFS family permease
MLRALDAALILRLSLLRLPELLLGAQTVLGILPHSLRVALALEESPEAFEHGSTIASARVSRYRWTILALGTGAQAAYSAAFLGIPVLAPELQAEYDLSLPEVGLVIAAFSLGSLLTLLPWGLLADRIGERWVLCSGLAGASAALVVAAVAPSYGVFITAVTVAGALGAAVNAASGRAVMAWFVPEQRGLALGIRQTALPVGGVIAALALPPIGEMWGLEGGLVALAAGCLVGAAAALIGLREAPAESIELGDVTHPLKDSRIWRLSVGSGLIAAAQISVLGFFVLFLHGERGLTIAQAGGILALTQLLGAALRIIVGRWSDHVRARVRPLRRLATGLAVSLVVVAALLEAPLAVLLPALVVAGGLSLSWNGLAYTAVAELAGRARSGAALGFQQTALSVASTAAAPVFAAVVDASSWQVGFGLAALLPAAGVAVMRGLAG